MLKINAKYQPLEFYIIVDLKIWIPLEFRHINHLREAYIPPPMIIPLSYKTKFRSLAPSWGIES